MDRFKIVDATGGVDLSNKDFADIVSAPFYFERFNSTEDVCAFIHESGMGAFRELIKSFETYKTKCFLRDLYNGEAVAIREKHGILV